MKQQVYQSLFKCNKDNQFQDAQNVKDLIPINSQHQTMYMSYFFLMYQIEFVRQGAGLFIIAKYQMDVTAIIALVLVMISVGNIAALVTQILLEGQGRMQIVSYLLFIPIVISPVATFSNNFYVLLPYFFTIGFLIEINQMLLDTWLQELIPSSHIKSMKHQCSINQVLGTLVFVMVNYFQTQQFAFQINIGIQSIGVLLFQSLAEESQEQLSLQNPSKAQVIINYICRFNHELDLSFNYYSWHFVQHKEGFMIANQFDGLTNKNIILQKQNNDLRNQYASQVIIESEKQNLNIENSLNDEEIIENDSNKLDDKDEQFQTQSEDGVKGYINKSEIAQPNTTGKKQSELSRIFEQPCVILLIIFHLVSESLFSLLGNFLPQVMRDFYSLSTLMIMEGQIIGVVTSIFLILLCVLAVDYFEKFFLFLILGYMVIILNLLMYVQVHQMIISHQVCLVMQNALQFTMIRVMLTLFRLVKLGFIPMDIRQTLGGIFCLVTHLGVAALFGIIQIINMLNSSIQIQQILMIEVLIGMSIMTQLYFRQQRV